MFLNPCCRNASYSIMATEFDKNNLEIKKPKDEEWIKETKAYKEAMQITEGSYIENK